MNKCCISLLFLTIMETSIPLYAMQQEQKTQQEQSIKNHDHAIVLLATLKRLGIQDQVEKKNTACPVYTNFAQLPECLQSDIFYTTCTSSTSPNKTYISLCGVSHAFNTILDQYSQGFLAFQPKTIGELNALMQQSKTRKNNIGSLDLHRLGNHVSNQMLKEVVQHFPYLSKLNLASCFKLTAACAISIASLPHLTHLNLHNTNITDQSLYTITQSCPRIKDLDLSLCFSLAIARGGFIEYLHHLSYLNLRSTCITDNTLHSIIQSCPHIKLLDLTDCYKITQTYRHLLNAEEIACIACNTSLEKTSIRTINRPCSIQ